MNRIPLKDEELDILLNNNPEGRYDLKTISKLLHIQYVSVVKSYSTGLKKLKFNPKKWKRFLYVLEKYLEIKRRKREQYESSLNLVNNI